MINSKNTLQSFAAAVSPTNLSAEHGAVVVAVKHHPEIGEDVVTGGVAGTTRNNDVESNEAIHAEAIPDQLTLVVVDAAADINIEDSSRSPHVTRPPARSSMTLCLALVVVIIVLVAVVVGVVG